jgi:hypothetical protein
MPRTELASAIYHNTIDVRWIGQTILLREIRLERYEAGVDEWWEIQSYQADTEKVLAQDAKTREAYSGMPHRVVERVTVERVIVTEGKAVFMPEQAACDG